MARTNLHLIYLRDAPGLVLSKRPYRNWREIQAEYPDYLTSLGPWSAEDVIAFFAADFRDRAHWPFTALQIQEFARSSEPMELAAAPDNEVAPL